MNYSTAVLVMDTGARCVKVIYDIVGYVYNHLPSNSWGSREKVSAYLESLQKAA